jgi:Zn-dependent protease
MSNDFSLASLVFWYVVFLFSTTFHEFSHAVVAYLGGDRTAYEGGQVSLDPVPHIRRSPFGLVVVPLISFAFFGWMIGWASAPFDPRWASGHPRRYAAMSVAGPMANLLLAAVAFVAMKLLVGGGYLEFSSHPSLAQLVEAPGADGYRTPLGALAMGLSVMLNLNVLLGVFNLLPLPPLDGASVLEGLSPRHAGAFFHKVRTTPAFGFLGMVIAFNAFPYVAGPVLYFVHAALYGAPLLG